jgi:hypothetical protein
MSTPSEILTQLQQFDTLYPLDAADRDDRLKQIENRLDAINGVTEAAISRLLEQRSQIEASAKSLAILSSRCSSLCSSLAQIEEALSNRLHVG